MLRSVSSDASIGLVVFSLCIRSLAVRKNKQKSKIVMSVEYKMQNIARIWGDYFSDSIGIVNVGERLETSTKVTFN